MRATRLLANDDDIMIRLLRWCENHLGMGGTGCQPSYHSHSDMYRQNGGEFEETWSGSGGNKSYWYYKSAGDDCRVGQA